MNRGRVQTDTGEEAAVAAVVAVVAVVSALTGWERELRPRSP